MGKFKKNKRDEFVELIPTAAKRILDLGCGNGSLGKRLKERGAEVVGIEYDPELVNEARKNLDEVYCLNLDKEDIPYPQKYFDCIVCADILEHLRDPLSFLVKLKTYLADDGYIVASIPNIRYHKLISNLVFKGTWDYMDRGILDKSHIRFFTLVNIKELFLEAGYNIVDLERNIVANSTMKFFNAICFKGLKEILTYQYYIKAKKGPVISTNRKKRQF